MLLIKQALWIYTLVLIIIIHLKIKGIFKSIRKTSFTNRNNFRGPNYKAHMSQNYLARQRIVFKIMWILIIIVGLVLNANIIEIILILLSVIRLVLKGVTLFPIGHLGANQVPGYNRPDFVGRNYNQRLNDYGFVQNAVYHSWENVNTPYRGVEESKRPQHGGIGALRGHGGSVPNAIFSRS